jgi:hypothetical protein
MEMKLKCLLKKNIYLDYRGAHLVLGYTTISDVEQLLGKPDEIERKEYGGEGFYWEDLIIYEYENKNLALIFSGENDTLVRIVFLPNKDSKFSTFSRITQESKRDDLISYFTKSKYDIAYAGESTFWVTFYSDTNRNFEIIGGFQFDENGNITGLNYFIDNAWR